ncbi:hypothetical protein PG984_015307 [Apiospora sp. TS-2023a]
MDTPEPDGFSEWRPAPRPLLSRGDLPGKALAHPQTLTVAETYKILGWRPPEELYAAIRHASGGSSSRPLELIAKARASVPSYEALSMDELELLILGFRPFKPERREEEGPSMRQAESAWLRFPGNQEARNLVETREGVDGEWKDLFHSVADHCATNRRIRLARWDRYEIAEENGETGLLVQEFPPLGCRPLSDLFRELPTPPAGLTDADQPAAVAIEDDNPSEPPRSPTRDDVDQDGRPVWPSLPWVPYMYFPETPLFLFRRDHQDDPKWIEEVVTNNMPNSEEFDKQMSSDNFQGLNGLFETGELKSRYNALSEKEKADYEARSERLRQEAWEELAQYKELKRKRGGGNSNKKKEKRPLTPPPAPHRLQKQQRAGKEARGSPLTPSVETTTNIWSKGEGEPGDYSRPATRDDVDDLGRPAWPFLPSKGMPYPTPPRVLFRDEHKDENWAEGLSWYGLHKDLKARYNALTAGERADYEARSERLRQEAWDELEQRKRDGKRVFDP